MKLLCHHDRTFFKRALTDGQEFLLFDVDELNNDIIESIYNGRITKVHKDFALVDIGLSRPAILSRFNKDTFTEGQNILVQIKREAWTDTGEKHRGVDQKAPQVTTHLQIVTPYFVYGFWGQGVAFSKNAQGNDDVKSLGEAFIKAHGGILTFRSKAITAEKKHLVSALDQLQQTIIHINSPQHPIGLVHKGRTQLEKILDLYAPSEILCDTLADFKIAERFLHQFPHPSNLKLLHHNVFKEYGADEEFDAVYSPWFTLPSGGQIVIEFTSALVSIDVNRGQCDSLDITNAEAADLIPQLLKKFHISGNIIIDFAGNIPPHKKKQLLTQTQTQKSLPKDVIHCAWSALGWLEIRRPKTRMSLFEKFADPI